MVALPVTALLVLALGAISPPVSRIGYEMCVSPVRHGDCVTPVEIAAIEQIPIQAAVPSPLPVAAPQQPLPAHQGKQVHRRSETDLPAEPKEDDGWQCAACSEDSSRP